MRLYQSSGGACPTRGGGTGGRISIRPPRPLACSAGKRCRKGWMSGVNGVSGATCTVFLGTVMRISNRLILKNNAAERRSECGKPGAQRRVFHMETFKGAKRARGCGKPAGFSMAASPPSGLDEFASRPVPRLAAFQAGKWASDLLVDDAPPRSIPANSLLIGRPETTYQGV